MAKYFYILFVFVLVLISSGFAADGDGGNAGAFLQVPIGARPTAIGGAYIAVADDGAGPFFNPAGIANLKKNLFASSYRAMQLDRTLAYASILFPAKGNTALGVSWLYGGSGSVATRNNEGKLLGHDISQNNHDFSVIFAKRFEGFFSAGFRASYLHTTFAEMTAYTVSFDIGAMFYLDYLFDRETRDLMPIHDIKIGVVVRNLAAKYKWNNQKYYLQYSDYVLGSNQDDKVPFELGLGSSARFLNRKLLLAADIIINEKENAAFHGGGEYFVSPEFALRTGFSDGRFTAGSGYLFNLKNYALAIDYAFSTDKADEGSEHIFSFDFLF